ncbi:MAG: hypothetical protein JRI95_13855 [Deltaproteobacteria bacterium]|nr:hypothetical protein [Deltaproteobacteria bacterium]
MEKLINVGGREIKIRTLSSAEKRQIVQKLIRSGSVLFEEYKIALFKIAIEAVIDDASFIESLTPAEISELYKQITELNSLNLFAAHN